MFGSSNPFSGYEEDLRDGEIEDLKTQVRTLQTQLDMTLEAKSLEKNPILVFKFTEEIGLDFERIAKGLSKAWKNISGSDHVIFMPETAGELSTLNDSQLTAIGLKRIRSLNDREEYDRMLGG